MNPDDKACERPNRIRAVVWMGLGPGPAAHQQPLQRTTHNNSKDTDTARGASQKVDFFSIFTLIPPTSLYLSPDSDESGYGVT